MERRLLIERMYELNADPNTNKDELTKLMFDVLHNKISTDDAESKLRLLDPMYIRYEFIQNLVGKPIYKNIEDFKKGNLSEILIAKMVSSLVTQVLIQVEKNPEISAKSLQIDSLLDILHEYSETSKINVDKLNSLLINYGWSDSPNDSE